MEHSNYHLYEAAILYRDQIVLVVALLVLIPQSALLALGKFSQRAAHVACWLFIGGEYVSLAAFYHLL